MSKSHLHQQFESEQGSRHLGERDFRDFAESASLALHFVGPDGVILWANEAELNLLGYSREEYFGRQIAEFHVDAAVCEDILVRLKKGERLREYEARLRTKSGGIRHVLIDSSVLIENGEFIHTRCFTRDITQSRHVQEALRQSEERLSAIIETTPECIKVIASDGTVLHMNPAGLAMVQADCADEVVGTNIYGLIAPEDRSRFREFNERICRGERGSLKFDIIGLKGARRNAETRAAPFHNADDSYAQLAITRDITQSRVAEQALRESEQRFRMMTETSPVLVWMSGTDKLCFYFNKGWLDFVGRRLEQEVGNGWTENVHPEDFDRCLDVYTSCFDARRSFEIEYRLRHHSGQYRWILDRGVPRYTADGGFEGYVGGCLDIHDQKEAAEKVKTSLLGTQKLAAIVESSEDAIVSKDLNGIVVSWNRAAERIFGYTEQEMIGQPITTIIPLELQDDEPRILQTIARGERIEHFETVRLTKSGERVEVSLTISPVKDGQGRIIGAAKIARDITRQKKSDQALRTSERLASVGRLAATVAHEINNPLTAVTNLVYLAKQCAVRPDVRDYLAGAEEELSRISHLSKQTLGFYRETQGPSAVRFGTTVNQLVSVFASRARNKALQIRSELGQDPEIYAVPGEIRQLIANLLSNSIDAAPTGGTIRIRVSTSPGWNGKRRSGVRLTIADSGPGIPKSDQSRLFQPFFTTKRDVGTGLGLWVCKSIVENHHGSIRLKSSTLPGRSWTVFSVFLPSSMQEGTHQETIRRLATG